jgi:hypothetical protein
MVEPTSYYCSARTNHNNIDNCGHVRSNFDCHAVSALTLALESDLLYTQFSNAEAHNGG